MHEKYVKPWTDALRSGGYQQGRYYLKSNTGKYCCLGVLCEVVKQIDQLDVLWERDNKGNNTFMEMDGFLPQEIMEMTGIKTKDGVYSPANSLSCLNDRGATFDSIANTIEQHWRDL
jgi:hypothetical protein